MISNQSSAIASSSAGHPIWGLWARNLGIAATLCILPGALISVWYPTWTFLPYYSLGIGLFVAIWEMPLPGLHHLGFLFTSLIFRGVLYVCMSGPLFLDAPTTAGALSLASTGIVYLTAGISGESFLHPREFGNTRQTADKMVTFDGPIEIVHQTDRAVSIQSKNSRMMSPNRPIIDIRRPESAHVV